MKIVTVTSDNYLPLTKMLAESIRIWHADLPIVVYALESGWGDEQSAQLAGLDLEIRSLPEPDTRFRSGANLGSGSVHALWKLDALLEQDEPFLLLDADVLVLKPLDPIFKATEADGWFTVYEGTPLKKYHQGEVTLLTGFAELSDDLASFNTGVLGCDPAKHRAVFEVAREWGGQITNIFLGDQGLMNLAYYKLYQDIPEGRDHHFNGGWTGQGQVNLAQTILHFGGPKTRQAGMTKHSAMESVWATWPKGVKLVNLTDTEFWQKSMPHPWPWLNQCNQHKYRSFVKAMRRESRTLIGTPWLLVENEWQAYLLDRKLLNDLDRFWAQHSERFRRVRCIPTYHLGSDGTMPSRWGRRLRRWKDEAISLLPR